MAFVASKAIEFGVKFIDSLVTTKKEAEEARQKIHDLGQEARNAVDEINSNFKSTESTVKSVAGRYAELAQGVKNLGKATQSQGTLSNDEYAEFLDISDQLSDLFPSLTSGYDDNGRAILNLDGSVQNITTSLYDLVDAERAVASYEMQEKMGDIWDDYTLSVRETFGSIDEYQKKLDEVNAKSQEYENFKSSDATISALYSLNKDFYGDLFKEAGLSISEIRDKTYEELTKGERIAIENAFAEAQKEYSSQLRILQNNVESENKTFAKYVQASFEGMYAGTDYEALINGLIGNYDYTGMMSDIGFGDMDSVFSNVTWAATVDDIKKNVISKINSLDDDPELKAAFDEAYNGLLSIVPDAALAENIVQIEEYIAKLAEILDLDANQLKISLGYDLEADRQTLQSVRDRLGYDSKSAILQQTKDLFGLNLNTDNLVNSQRNKEIDEFVNLLSSEDADLLLNAEIPDSVLNGVEEDWKEFLEWLQAEADDNPIITRVDVATSADTFKSAFDDLFAAFDDYQENGLEGLDISNLIKLNNEDTFGNIAGSTASYERFLAVMQDVNATADEVHEAFNQLASDYIYHSDLADQITESNRDYIQSELEKNGVVNASAVVEQMMINKYGLEEMAIRDCINANLSLNGEKIDSANASEKLANATAEEIGALFKEASAAGVAANSLYQYMLDKISAGKYTITTDGDIANLIGLGEALGASTKLISQFIEVKQALDNAMNGGAPGIVQTEIEKKLNELKYQITASISKGNVSNSSAGGGGYRTSSGGGGGGSSSGSSSKPQIETFDWIETAVSNIEEAINQLDKTVGNTYTNWSNRNAALSSELEKTKEEINLQQQTYDTYMNKANAVGLSDAYKQKVQAGTMQIEDITDETLKEQINDYQNWYEKAKDCSDAVKDLKINLGKLAETKFDNLQKELEGYISMVTAYADLIDERINRTEEHGYFVSKDYYKQLIAYENQELAQLQREYKVLADARDNALASGVIEEGSEAWNDMTKEILDVEKAIEECTTSLVEFNNAIRDLDWEIFDYIEDRIGQITQESDFLIDLLDNGKLYDESGALNAAGLTNMALHGANYNTYMQQAVDYANELKKVQKDLSNDSANKDLIKRREELLKLQQEAITNAEAEKDAVKSLVEEGINLHLDALDKLISKYEDSLDAAKDLYEYQKKIAEQTDEIANLEKILMAYQGDDSEEARKTIQETKNQLEKARTNLEETEWDKYISETKDLLKSLRDDYSEVLNARLDNIDALMADMIDTANANTDTIRDTILSTADRVGYTISDTMKSILGDGSKTVTMLSSFYSKFETTATTLQSAINAIKSYVYSMTDEGKRKVTAESTQNTNQSSTPSSGTTSTPSSTTSSNPSTTNANANTIGDGKANVGDAVTFISGKYHEDSWGNGRSGSQMLGGTVYITKIASSSPYPYHISRTSKFGEHNLGWVKLDQLRGYSMGAKRINSDQWAWTQENGAEMIYRTSDGAILTPLGKGNMVFNKEQSETLWELSQGNLPNMPDYLQSLPNITGNARTVNNENHINVTLPNVKNYDEFKTGLQHDNRFIGFMQEVTLGQALGRNKLNKNKY